MATTSKEAEQGSILARLEAFRQSDAERDELVRNLIDQYSRLEALYGQKCGDYENEVGSRRRWQKEAIDLKNNLQLTRDSIERNPFALVLIDGDGVLFHDALLAAGSEGGSEAAHKLSNEIKQLIHDRHENTSNWTIMVHIYANFEGLSKRLGQLGIIDSPARLHAFSRAFSMSQPFFNFLDVGSGKEYADHKIKGMFQLFLSNLHCKHIVFGGSHDNGYLTTLNQYKRDDAVAKRMTLLESTPAERGYAALGYPIVQFNSVFRDQPLPDPRPLNEMTNGNNVPLARPPSIAALPTAPLARTTSAQQSQNSVVTQSRMSPAPPSTNGSSTGPPTPAPKVASPATSTWATVGKTDTKVISIAPAKPVASSRRCILLNASDERLDQKLLKPDKDSQFRLTQRIKEQKICNDFHLLGKCYKLEYCEFKHGERLPQSQQLALRVKARQRACTEGSDCRDVDCFYGHVCPNDPCSWEYCHFGDRHVPQIDVVPYMRMFEDGSIEIIH